MEAGLTPLSQVERPWIKFRDVQLVITCFEYFQLLFLNNKAIILNRYSTKAFIIVQIRKVINWILVYYFILNNIRLQYFMQTFNIQKHNDNTILQTNVGTLVNRNVWYLLVLEGIYPYCMLFHRTHRNSQHCRHTST